MSYPRQHFLLKGPLISTGFFTLLLVTAYVYWPGLNGPFLFDDFANLNALGKYDGVRDWATLKLYLFGNHSGPTGRPVSMLSFLLNATDWPTNPWPFKFTNLVLHLLNGILLFILARNVLLIGRIKPSTASGIALLTAGFWLLHPLNVSTVLYPVQRMTILATLFVLFGLVGYVHGRQLIKEQPRLGHWWMSLSIILGTILATFSKENGALLPLFALCLELTVFSQLAHRPDRRWQAVFLWLPAILLAAYFTRGLMTGGIQNGYAIRPFTLTERLLTEPRILFDYLYYWFIPHIDSPGLLTQDFPLSRSPLEPKTTVLAILGILGLLTLAIRWRMKHPMISLAILFFFVGHLIESTFISLELYFEHRNYLPAIFLILPVASGIVSLAQKHKIWSISAILLIAVPATLTAQRASIWSNEEALFYHWADNHPNSQRAQRNAALIAEKHQKYELAYNILSSAKQRLPDNVAIQLHWIILACRFDHISTETQQTYLKALQDGFFSFRNTNLLRSSIEFIHEKSCASIDPGFAYEMIKALEKNATAIKKGGARHQLHHVRGILHLDDDLYELAAQDFSDAQKVQRQLESGMYQTALLATKKQYDLALKHLNLIEKTINIEKVEKAGTLAYSQEIARLKEQILADRLEQLNASPETD